MGPFAQQVAHQVFAYLANQQWMDFFRNIVIPSIASLVLTFAKAIADDENAISWEKVNDIALDLVILGVGLLCGIYINTTTVVETVNQALVNRVDRGVVDRLLKKASVMRSTRPSTVHSTPESWMLSCHPVVDHPIFETQEWKIHELGRRNLSVRLGSSRRDRGDQRFLMVGIMP